MGLFDLIGSLLGGGSAPAKKPSGPAGPSGPAFGELGLDELARRLGVTVDELRAVPLTYREFTVPKKSGGERKLAAPGERLAVVQRLILRRLLGRLEPHEAAEGFRRGHSAATHAKRHMGRAVVVTLDVKDFFARTSSDRVLELFGRVGWNREAAELLVRLTTHRGGLPQGAPTSPALSNLVNRRLDARLAGAAEFADAVYSRYADDLAFSFDEDEPFRIRELVRVVKFVLAKEGYKLHHRKKLHVRRRHNRQLVTGLVVNEHLAVPRWRRRWLRAVVHRMTHGGGATLRPDQVAGWAAYLSMIEKAGGPPPSA